MSPPLAELTARAQTLTTAGDLTGARQVLARLLEPADTDPQRASADLAVAAALHARVLTALGDPHAARTWARFAHAAHLRLHGPRDERTVAAAALHAAVLHRVGLHEHAVQAYQQLARDLAEVDGPDGPRVLAAQADLATAEHAAGHCATARARLADCWDRHRVHHGEAAPAGIKMLARLGAMERDCGRDAEAQAHLALAYQLCTQHLPADHPLTQQVAGLSAEPPTGRHHCADSAPQTGQPPGVVRLDAPGVQAVPEPRRPMAPDALGQPAPPANAEPPKVPDHPRWTSSEHLLPAPVTPWGERPSAKPYVLAGVLVGGILSAGTVLLLTLPDWHQAASRATTATAVPTAAPGSSPPGPVVPAAAPTGLRLRDSRDSVTLTWVYPAAAEGPVLISGGRQGQPPRAFQEVPAGSKTYVVYGLNSTRNYCFTVSVVYATDRIAATDPVCTHR